jgi:hypothetical protein
MLSNTPTRARAECTLQPWYIGIAHHLNECTRICRRHAPVVLGDEYAKRLKHKVRSQRLVPQVRVSHKSGLHKDKIRLLALAQVLPEAQEKHAGSRTGGNDTSRAAMQQVIRKDATGHAAYLFKCRECNVRVNNEVLKQLVESTEFVFHGEFSEKDVTPAGAALQINRIITKIHLEDCHIGDGGGEALVRALMGGAITSLSIVGCRVRMRTSLALADMFKAGDTALEILHLDKNPLTDKGIESFVQELAVSSTPLTHLGLNSTEIGQRSERAVAALVTLLSSFVSALPCIAQSTAMSCFRLVRVHGCA